MKYRAVADKSQWHLDPNSTFLNHGSYGATPIAVLDAQDVWRRRMERHPTGFMTYELPIALRNAAKTLAKFVGCKPDSLVFTENATAGCNAILNSTPLRDGDEILLTSHGYPAVLCAAEYVSRGANVRLIEADVPFPTAAAEEIIEAVSSRISERTRLVIIDHVTSPTAVVFPIRELVAMAHAAGALVLVDGAHAPGMMSLEIEGLGADYYVGNCHKWLMAPKGSAFIWAAPELQRHLHPCVISHGYLAGYTSEFDWTGTRDPTGWLSVEAAIDFHEKLGGHKFRTRNSDLVRTAADLLCQAWDTERGSPDCLTGSMATVRLPISPPPTVEAADRIRRKLFEKHRIEIAIIPFSGALWARISAQAYNSLSDYERLVPIFL